MIHDFSKCSIKLTVALSSTNSTKKEKCLEPECFLFLPQCFLFYQRQVINLRHILKTFNTFQNKPLFLLVCSISLLKTLWEKEKLLVKNNFFLSNSVFPFYPFGKLSAISTKFKIVQVCKLKFVVSERLNWDQFTYLIVL